MTPAGFTMSMSLNTVAPILHRAPGHVLPLLEIAGNGGTPDPIPIKLCPCTKLKDFRLLDPLILDLHYHRGDEDDGPTLLLNCCHSDNLISPLFSA